jgi:hypothetical protein
MSLLLLLLLLQQCGDHRTIAECSRSCGGRSSSVMRILPVARRPAPPSPRFCSTRTRNGEVNGSCCSCGATRPRPPPPSTRRSSRSILPSKIRRVQMDVKTTLHVIRRTSTPRNDGTFLFVGRCRRVPLFVRNACWSPCWKGISC